jgi:hypothetical protein
MKQEARHPGTMEFQEYLNESVYSPLFARGTRKQSQPAKHHGAILKSCFLHVPLHKKHKYICLFSFKTKVSKLK